MKKKLARTIYIAQVAEHYFDVAFNCPMDDFPFHHTPERVYSHISRPSLRRLNRLTSLPDPRVKIAAHLYPYVCLWVTFPPKGK